MKYDKFSRLFWRAVDDARTSIMCVKICADNSGCSIVALCIPRAWMVSNRIGVGMGREILSMQISLCIYAR